MNSLCHMISQDHLIRESCDFNVLSLSCVLDVMTWAAPGLIEMEMLFLYHFLHRYLRKSWPHRFDLPLCEITKIRNADLQFRNLGYGWQKNEKKKKKKTNTANCKAFCVSRKRNKNRIDNERNFTFADKFSNLFSTLIIEIMNVLIYHSIILHQSIIQLLWSHVDE